MPREDCLFCKIIRREIPATTVYEDDRILVFKDIAPAAPVHLLIVPKTHLDGLNAAGFEHIELLGYIQCQAAVIASGIPELASGYRLITNSGEWGGQSVPHLHYHLIGGKPLAWSF
jgi:histidine triad (HIT) family protein